MEHYVANINTLREQEIMQVEVMYRSVLLIYSDGKIYAIEDKCPHQGISLATGKVDGDVIRCKDHGLPISLKTGAVTSERQAAFMRLGQNSRAVSTYSVVLKGEKIFISI